MLDHLHADVMDGNVRVSVTTSTSLRRKRASISSSSTTQELLSLVSTCPDRGGVLPLSMQDDCGCKGKELSACNLGKGAISGRVTLADCLACRSAFLATPPPPPKIELATTITLEQKLAICEGCVWGTNGVCGETQASFSTSARLGCPVGRHGGPLPGRQD
jgi:hypothetical protein